MTKINKHIEIVTSSKHGLSSMSPKSREAIQDILSQSYTRVGITIVDNLSDLTLLAARRPDLVFLGMKCVPRNPELGATDPDKIWVSQYLNERGIRHTGSGQLAIKLEMNKEMAKRRVAAAGLKTAKYLVIPKGTLVSPGEVTLSYPLFIKPTNRGGGVGVDEGSLVRNYSQLRAKLRSLSIDLQADALVEEYLPGREFSVAILKEAYTDRYTVMPLELVAPMDKTGARFLSAQVKSADTERHMEVTDLKLKTRIDALAIEAFRALGAKDYGRIDIRLDGHGEPHFLEANLLPSLMNGYGNFPKACLLNKGLGHEQMILKIVSLAFSRATNPLQNIIVPNLDDPTPTFKPA